MLTALELFFAIIEALMIIIWSLHMTADLYVVLVVLSTVKCACMVNMWMMQCHTHTFTHTQPAIYTMYIHTGTYIGTCTGNFLALAAPIMWGLLRLAPNQCARRLI